jgi:hypothetical protein
VAPFSLSLVHIDPKVITVVVLTGLLCAPAWGKPEPAAPATPSGHAGHSAQAQAGSPPSPDGPPSGSTGFNQPSWFAGGESLYVPAYYDSFKGIDLASLTPLQRERFLHWVNTEFCACNQSGCRRDTIANCYTNDPTCPRAPARIREILEKVRQGAVVPGTPRQPWTPTPSAPAR